jgi:hypothetical protein
MQCARAVVRVPAAVMCTCCCACPSGGLERKRQHSNINVRHLDGDRRDAFDHLGVHTHRRVRRRISLSKPGRDPGNPDDHLDEPRADHVWNGLERQSVGRDSNVDGRRCLRNGRRNLHVYPDQWRGLGRGQQSSSLHRVRDHHNERLAVYCLANQIPLVDIASKFRDEHFGDELHPNDVGAYVIALEVYLSIAGFTPLSQ